LTEWYENRPAGIEQGFTLSESPRRQSYILDKEPLRLVVALEGDLRARVKDEGKAIELTGKDGRGALSYSELIAQDADGKKLAARMEASADGREIALVVDDAGARYPIVIDPIVASLEKKLNAGSFAQADARFGFDVAIDGDMAVVGAWRQDTISGGTTLFDAGYVYTFSRSGTQWSAGNTFVAGNAFAACGWSVAISGTRAVFGCPGANNDRGTAFIIDLPSGNYTELNPPFNRTSGERYGTSVSINGDSVLIGAPVNNATGTNAGMAFSFTVNSNLVVTNPRAYPQGGPAN
jgi:hypothetical protein